MREASILEKNSLPSVSIPSKSNPSEWLRASARRVRAEMSKKQAQNGNPQVLTVITPEQNVSKRIPVSRCSFQKSGVPMIRQVSEEEAAHAGLQIVNVDDGRARSIIGASDGDSIPKDKLSLWVWLNDRGLSCGELAKIFRSTRKAVEKAVVRHRNKMSNAELEQMAKEYSEDEDIPAEARHAALGWINSQRTD